MFLSRLVSDSNWLRLIQTRDALVLSISSWQLNFFRILYFWFSTLIWKLPAAMFEMLLNKFFKSFLREFSNYLLSETILCLIEYIWCDSRGSLLRYEFLVEPNLEVSFSSEISSTVLVNGYSSKDVLTANGTDGSSPFFFRSNFSSFSISLKLSLL